jgi:uncharacterized membrane protein YsdA (DUF1294 family)
MLFVFFFVFFVLFCFFLLNTSIHWSFHCTVHVYVVIHFCDIAWYNWDRRKNVAGLNRLKESPLLGNQISNGNADKFYKQT